MSSSSPWANRISGYGSESPQALLPNPRNARRHPDAQTAALAGVLSSVGIVQNVIVNRQTGLLVDGHARVELARRSGQTSVPVTYVDLSPAEEATILATLDPIGALADYDAEALSSLLAEVSAGDAAVDALLADLARQYPTTPAEPAADPGAQPDRAAELAAKWGTGRGQLWTIGAHRLMCGDSADAGDVARLMGGEMAVLLATDPPYNVGIAYGENVDDAKVAAEYERFSRSWFGLWQTASNRQLVTPAFANLSAWLRWFDAFHVAPWTKTNSMTRGSVAQWACWEPVLFFGAGWERRRTNDVFNFPSSAQSSDGLGSLTPFHPCPKPLPMWLDIFEHYSDAGDLVADAFAGSGTAFVAAEQTGRRCYGMDIEAKYTAVILERMAGMGLSPERF